MEFSNWVWIIPTQEVRVAKQWNRCAWFWAVNSKQEIWRWTLIAITLGDWGWAVNCAGDMFWTFIGHNTIVNGIVRHWNGHYPIPIQWALWDIQFKCTGARDDDVQSHKTTSMNCTALWCPVILWPGFWPAEDHSVCVLAARMLIAGRIAACYCSRISRFPVSYQSPLIVPWWLCPAKIMFFAHICWRGEEQPLVLLGLL